MEEDIHRRSSISQVYETTWKVFMAWEQWEVILTRPRVKDFLEFLQLKFNKGLSTATLKWQVSASILGFPRGRVLSPHSRVKKFLEGVALLSPCAIPNVGSLLGAQGFHQASI